jgi:hypothetical protein
MRKSRYGALMGHWRPAQLLLNLLQLQVLLGVLCLQGELPRVPKFGPRALVQVLFCLASRPVKPALLNVWPFGNEHEPAWARYVC